jgi:hypothetical protein
VRVALAGLGAALVALAFAADALLGGVPGFGPQQAILLALGISVAALSLLPVRILANLALAAAGIGFTLVVSEIGLRVFAGPQFAMLYRLHPSHLHEMIPGASRIFTRQPVNGGGSHRIEVNTRGFRGAELLPAGTRPRVVVYGDSFIAGEYSPLEKTFVHQLGVKLGAALGTPVEAVNAGVVSYGPDQLSVRMEEELGWLAPDLVIVSVFADNDFGDLVRNKLFTLAPDGSLVPNEFSIAPGLESRFWMAQHSPYLYRVFARVLGSLLVHQLPPEEQIERDLEDCRREWREYVVEGDNTVRERMLGRYDADVSLEPESDSARFKVRLMDGVLGRIAAIAREHDVPLLLMIIPSPVDAVEGYDLGRVDEHRHPAYQRTALTDAVAAAAARQGIATVNLMETFRAHDAKALYFRGGDNHWNDAGQELAAQTLADAVISRRLMRTKGQAE